MTNQLTVTKAFTCKYTGQHVPVGVYVLDVVTRLWIKVGYWGEVERAAKAGV